jgi:hypothetical protein
VGLNVLQRVFTDTRRKRFELGIQEPSEGMGQEQGPQPTARLRGERRGSEAGGGRLRPSRHRTRVAGRNIWCRRPRQTAGEHHRPHDSNGAAGPTPQAWPRGDALGRRGGAAGMEARAGCSPFHGAQPYALGAPPMGCARACAPAAPASPYTISTTGARLCGGWSWLLNDLIDAMEATDWTFWWAASSLGS